MQSNSRFPFSLVGEIKRSLSTSDIEKLARQFEPHRDKAIPLFLRKIKDGESVVRQNAIGILAHIGDHRTALQLLNSLESENFWGTTRKAYVEAFIGSLQKQSAEERRLSLDKISEYLEQRRPDPSAGTPRYQCFLQIINALSLLNDPQVETIFEKQIASCSCTSEILQSALISLAQINPEKAILCLRMKMGLTEGKDIRSYTDRLKVLGVKKSKDNNFYIAVWARDEFETKERSYEFKYENGWVYFVYGGTNRRLAGRAQNEAEAIQAATEYLAWWLSFCGAI